MQMKLKIINFSRFSRILVVLLITLILICPLIPSTEFSVSDGLSQDEVKTAVETWVRYVTADAKPDAVIEKMEPYQVEGNTVAYIAHIKGGGFCLCGADYLVLPVYLYSPQGTYDLDNPNYQYILCEISTILKNLQEGLEERSPRVLQYQEALSQRASYWKELIAGRIPTRPEDLETPAGEPEKMELTLTSRWHQGSPYNNLCPMGDGGRCVVGCVATAIAQIMRYWTWPPSGTGSSSYTWDGDDSCPPPGPPVGGGTLSATYSDTYDWQNMPDDCIGGCTQTEQDALAELSYEVGVSITMNYGRCASGSDLYRAVVEDFDAPLINNFSYDSDAFYESNLKEPYIDIEAMVNEIQWLRPIAFGGTLLSGGGHAWVIHGYNKGTSPVEFLMYMGQQGDSPEWYSLDGVANPDHHNYILQIAPQNVVRFVGNTIPGDGSPDNPHQNIEEAIALAPNYATLIFKAGSTNTFSTNTLTINRPFTLKGEDVVICKV